MKVTAHISVQCECGWEMENTYLGEGFESALICKNSLCPNHGKKFKHPTIELEEINPA